MLLQPEQIPHNSSGTPHFSHKKPWCLIHDPDDLHLVSWACGIFPMPQQRLMNDTHLRFVIGGLELQLCISVVMPH